MTLHLRFFFDPGSGVCLWADNDAARRQFGYAVELDALPLTAATRTAAEQLLDRFDQSIDWEDPAGAGPWTEDEQTAFVSAARTLLERIRHELGPEYEVHDAIDLVEPAQTLRLTLVESRGPLPEGMTIGQSFDLRIQRSAPLVIGRAPDADFRVRALSVGMRVARLTLTPEGIWLEDLGSGGGSAITMDGVTTSRPACPLPDNALLWLGGVCFRVGLRY